MSEVISLPTPKNVANRGFCLTPTADAVCGLLEVCRSSRVMALISGASGVGKTAAALEFVRANPRTAYCNVISAARNLQPGLTRIAEAIGAGPGVRNAAPKDLHDEIVRHVSMDWLDLLVLDEVEVADDEQLNAVRNIFDACPRRLGVVFIGDVDTKSRFEGGGKRNHATFRPLLKRTVQTLLLEEVTSADVAALCAHHGLSGESRSLVKKVVARGGLHLFDSLMRVATSQAAGGVINHRHLLEAGQMTGVLS